MSRYCSSLKENEQVVFLLYSDIYNKKIPYDGTVVYVDRPSKKVSVCYLEGYKSYTDSIPFSDMLAVYDEKGKMMHFDNISGPSQKLINR